MIFPYPKGVPFRKGAQAKALHSGQASGLYESPIYKRGWGDLLLPVLMLMEQGLTGGQQ